MSHYTCSMVSNIVNGSVIFWGIFIYILVRFLYFGGIFNISLTIIPPALVGYEMIIGKLAIYHLLSNKREWDNCLIYKEKALHNYFIPCHRKKCIDQQ